jgi:hypothetical protein
MRERILKDGAIPARYKLLMAMITGANRRARGRCQGDRRRRFGAEITEAVEVGYLYGGTAALVMGVNAFAS